MTKWFAVDSWVGFQTDRVPRPTVVWHTFVVGVDTPPWRFNSSSTAVSMARGSLLQWPVNVVFRPSALVALRAGDRPNGLLATLGRTLSITVFYGVNRLLYALPLTLAGVSGSATASVPPAVRATVALPAPVWDGGVALVQNSVFLFSATVLTFLTFHLGIVLTGSSDGLVQSLRTEIATIIASAVAILVALIAIRLGLTLLVLSRTQYTIQGDTFRREYEFLKSTDWPSTSAPTIFDLSSKTSSAMSRRSPRRCREYDSLVWMRSPPLRRAP